MLALLLSNKLFSCDCNLNIAEKCLGFLANMGGQYWGKLKDAEEDDDDNNDDNDDDDDDDDEDQCVE